MRQLGLTARLPPKRQTGVPPIDVTTPKRVIPKRAIFQLLVTTFLVGVGVSVYASSGSISWQELLKALRTFGLKGSGLSLGFLVGQVLFMILRYRALLPTTHAPSNIQVAYSISVGQAVNNYFPARLGDFLKAVLLSRGSQTAPSTERHFTFLKAVGLIVADRIVDIMALLLLVLLSGALWIPAKWVPQPVFSIRSTLLVALLAGSIFFLCTRPSIRKHIGNRLTQLRSWFQEFQSGFRGVLEPYKLVMAAVFAALSWWCEILSLQALTAMLGFAMTFSQAVFVLLALNFFISVPLSIANFGPFEAGVVLALQAVQDIPKEQALAVATVHHLAQMTSVTLVALASALLYRSKKRYKGL